MFVCSSTAAISIKSGKKIKPPKQGNIHNEMELPKHEDTCF
jgi:hypothetical protein